MKTTPQLGAQSKQQLKDEHRDRMVRIGIEAVEHSLRFLPEANPTRTVVEERLAGLRDRNFDLASIQSETTYTQESCIRRASGELLKLAVSEKWLSGNSLVAVFTPCWDAGSFVGRGDEAQKEMKWQNENLYPQIETAFEKLRAAEKTLAA